MNNHRNSLFLTIPILFFFCHSTFAQMKTENFEFQSDGKKLSGILDLPSGHEPTAFVIIVQGSGRSDVVAGNWYYDLRSHFVQLGLACFIWDKPGCGKSEGNFDINQSVQSSARDVLSAIEALKSRGVSGSAKIGLWGISRAGWICPLVIQDYPLTAFWISVSGTDDKENFGYLLETNFRIEGRSESQTRLLVEEWKRGNDIFRKGGSPEEYLKATHDLQRDSFCISFLGYRTFNREEYLQNQKMFINEHHEFDEETGLMIYVPHFRETLNKIKCPVLAIFGEKDANVDWRKTMALYMETIGNNVNAKLTFKTFPDGNHNIQKCKNGGLRELNDPANKHEMCDGYFKTILTWLAENGFGK